jgi:hypothetical protein
LQALLLSSFPIGKKLEEEFEEIIEVLKEEILKGD